MEEKIVKKENKVEMKTEIIRYYQSSIEVRSAAFSASATEWSVQNGSTISGADASTGISRKL